MVLDRKMSLNCFKDAVHFVDEVVKSALIYDI